MSRIRTSITIAALIVAATATASMPMIDEAAGRRSMLTTSVDSALYESNPALQQLRYATSLSSVGLGMSYQGADEAPVVQTGTGHLLGSVDARSYYRLDEASVVWGNASYTAGQYRDIKWNNCRDYDLLSPYVLGDSVGGNLQTREYRFGGGYARRDGRFVWGAQAEYRASIDYRNRDPRLKIVVSDLIFNIGGGIDLSQRYTFGASVGLRVYNQDSNLKFFNPLNNILTYAMTGLGTVYERFSGSNNDNSAYTFTGIDASLQLAPRQYTGFALTGRYAYYRTNQILRDFNNLTLTHLSSHTFTASGSWRYISGAWKGAVCVDGYWNRRLGTENLFGTAVGNTYEIIAQRTYYYHDIVDATIKLPTQLRVGTSLVNFTPAASYIYSHESYRRPQRDTEYSLWRPSATLSYAYEGSKAWRPEVSVYGDYTYADAKAPVLTALNPTSSLGSMVISNFDNASCRRHTIGAAVTADIAVSEAVVATVSARYAHAHYATGIDIDNINMTITLNF